jgi:hypothetical protein
MVMVLGLGLCVATHLPGPAVLSCWSKTKMGRRLDRKRDEGKMACAHAVSASGTQ